MLLLADTVGLQPFPPAGFKTSICGTSCVSCYWSDYKEGFAD